MDTLELFLRLSVALAIGMMVGLERGWQERDDPEGERAAGFRTFALGGLLGGIWGATTLRLGDAGAMALGLAFATFSAAIVLFRYRETGHDKTFGATTIVAAMLVFALGAFAVIGDIKIAAATGVAVMVLLALKTFLHAWLKKISWIELRSALVLLTMTFILLPLLPNRTIDPWSAINPFEIWLLTIMIAIISFVGYVSIKAFGARRGILFSAVAGGLASSTAMTLTMARLARQHPAEGKPLAGGALIAGATMIVRVLVVAGLVNVYFLKLLALPLGAAAVALGGFGLFLVHSGGAERGAEPAIVLKNPFELETVLKFGALLTVVTALAKILTAVAGQAGAYALALFSGIADVDAITLSMSRLAGAGLSVEVAALAIALAAAVNTVSKAVLGWVAGGEETGKRLAAGAGVAIAAGVAGYLLQIAF